jgi:hypothetical protein
MLTKNNDTRQENDDKRRDMDDNMLKNATQKTKTWKEDDAKVVDLML